MHFETNLTKKWAPSIPVQEYKVIEQIRTIWIKSWVNQINRFNTYEYPQPPHLVEGFKSSHWILNRKLFLTAFPNFGALWLKSKPSWWSLSNLSQLPRPPTWLDFMRILHLTIIPPLGLGRMALSNVHNNPQIYMLVQMPPPNIWDGFTDLWLLTCHPLFWECYLRILLLFSHPHPAMWPYDRNRLFEATLHGSFMLKINNGEIFWSFDYYHNHFIIEKLFIHLKTVD